jgi:hypothetical protein
MGHTTKQRPDAEEVLEKLLVGNKHFVEGNLCHITGSFETSEPIIADYVAEG